MSIHHLDMFNVLFLQFSIFEDVRNSFSDVGLLQIPVVFFCSLIGYEVDVISNITFSHEFEPCQRPSVV